MSFRRAMDPLHTWAGVLFSALLFAIFLTGTLAVFDQEIDRWTQPHTRRAVPDGPVSLAPAVAALEQLAPAKANFWLIDPADERTPVTRIAWQDGQRRVSRDLDAATGALLPEQGAPIGTRLFYPFHYMLHWRAFDLGEWLVGLAAMVMLVGIVSGVAVHRRLFKDFFLFRPHKGLQRSALDLHVVTGVFALPFHFMLPFSGLVIMASVYLAPVIGWVYDGPPAAFSREVLSRYQRPASGAPSHNRLPLDTLVARAEARWTEQGEPGRVGRLILRQPRDAAAVVEVRRAQGARVSLTHGTLYFDAKDGRLLHAEALSAATRVTRFLAGLHLAQFDAPLLRWLYFVMGLSGCVMLGAGSIVWVAKRAERHARLGWRGAAVMQALNIASITGLLLACTGVMLINTLPHPLWTGDADALTASLRWFFALWALAALHAAHVGWPAQRRWRQQAITLTAIAVAAVVSQRLQHPAPHGAAAGVEATLLILAAGSACLARRLRPSPTPTRWHPPQAQPT